MLPAQHQVSVSPPRGPQPLDISILQCNPFRLCDLHCGQPPTDMDPSISLPVQSYSARPDIDSLLQCISEFSDVDPMSVSNKVVFRKTSAVFHDIMLSHPSDHTTSVLNFSSHPLSPTELSFLQKGLKFCPTQGEPDMSSLANDLSHFHNNLRWAHYFRDIPPNKTHLKQDAKEYH